MITDLSKTMMVNGQLVEKAVEKMGLVSDYYT